MRSLARTACCQRLLRSDEGQAVHHSRLLQGREIIADIPLFRSFLPDERTSVVRAMRSMEYRPGQYIIEQGQTGSTFFILIQGRCRVTVQDVLCPGAEKEVAQINTGDYFGEARTAGR